MNIPEQEHKNYKYEKYRGVNTLIDRLADCGVSNIHLNEFRKMAIYYGPSYIFKKVKLIERNYFYQV